MSDLEVIIKAAREESDDCYWTAKKTPSPTSEAFHAAAISWNSFANRLQSELDKGKPAVEPEQEESE